MCVSDEVLLLDVCTLFHRNATQLYCCRIYDISSSSDEKSEETDKESDDDGNGDNEVTKAVTGTC